MASFRQSSLLLYLIILLGFVLGFMYNSQLDPTVAVPPLDPKFGLASLRGLEHVKINDTILNSDQFTTLRVFGQLPVQVTGGGKSNPFQ
jgi:hypothetical protein